MAILVEESILPLETAAVWQVFTTYLSHAPAGSRTRDVEFASATGTDVALFGLGSLTPRLSLEHAARADVVFLAPTQFAAESDASLAGSSGAAEAKHKHLGRVLQRALGDGATVLATGTSVFRLARTGILDGRVATTHASLTAQFKQEFPQIVLRPEALFVEDGRVMTAAGGAATIDLCLHAISRIAGPSQASRVEQALQTGARRSGRHGQRLESQLNAADPQITELLAWITSNLHLQLSVEMLASRSFMSRRSLARRFRAATGSTPYAWIIEQRVRRARELLADDRYTPVQEIAWQVGFGSAGALRHHFLQSLGVTPTLYREALRPSLFER